MKAVVFHGIGDIKMEDVSEPKILEPFDAIVKITSSAICGTDLHMIRGTMSGMVEGTILGHEGVGVVEEVGANVRNIKRGDRVIIPSTIACGYCSYCRAGYFSQCDNANPHGPQAGTAFFGGPKETGPFNGLQAEYARVPFANVGLVKIPDNVNDDEAILLSDIFPTGYFGAKLAQIKSGDTVAVFGCGPVGQFAIISAHLQGAARVIAVDKVQSRLEMARNNGAEVINFEKEDPVKVIMSITGNIGVDRVIDAVGVDSETAHHGPAAKKSSQMQEEFNTQQKKVAPKTNPQGNDWHPGDAPGQALMWAVQAIAKAGTLGIIGVYPQSVQFFPLGMAMNKNLSINSGNCNHRKYIPYLLELVQSKVIDPRKIITQQETMMNVLDAYKEFDKRSPGWIKVELKPSRKKEY